MTGYSITRSADMERILGGRPTDGCFFRLFQPMFSSNLPCDRETLDLGIWSLANENVGKTNCPVKIKLVCHFVGRWVIVSVLFNAPCFG